VRIGAALLLGCPLVLLPAGCGTEEAKRSALDGNPERGKLLLRQFACGSCHDIPGVAAAKGKVGPPLAGISGRVYLAGVLPTTPQNMAAFIREPHKFAPRTAMPAMGVNEEQVRDMVAYLYTLQ
jgi:cytochrome c2